MLVDREQLRRGAEHLIEVSGDEEVGRERLALPVADHGGENGLAI